MILEVIIEGQESVAYILNRPEIYIGSNPAADIVISLPDISRKHAKVFTQENKFWIMDMGSTNGTYVNEEQLIPGRREELKVETLIRLGATVTLSLAEKHKNPSQMNSPTTPAKQVMGEHDKTRIISLKELEATRARNLKKKKMKARAQKAVIAKRKQADKKILTKTLTILGVILSVAFILQTQWKSISRTLIKPFVGSKSSIQGEYKIPKAKLYSLIKIDALLKSPKCLRPLEAVLCNHSESLKQASNGVIIKENDVIFFVELGPWLIESEDFLKSISTLNDNEIIDPEKIIRVAFLEFSRDVLSKVDQAKFEDHHFYISFYITENSESKVSQVYALRSGIIPLMNKRYEKIVVSKAKGFGRDFVGDFDRYFHRY